MWTYLISILLAYGKILTVFLLLSSYNFYHLMQVTVKGVEAYTKSEEGLYYLDTKEGRGATPLNSPDGEVIFHYTAYNENGGRIDSSYRQGQPARGKLGINAMIPGFELGIKSMKVGGKRRIVVRDLV